MLHLGDLKIAQTNNMVISSLPQQGAKATVDVSSETGFFNILKGQVQSADQVSPSSIDRPEPQRNVTAAPAEDKQPREDTRKSTQKDEPSQSQARAEEQQGQKAAAQLQGKEGKSADTKNTTEKKQAVEQQPAGKIDKEAGAGTRIREKQKHKKAGEPEMQELQDGLYRMIDFLKGKDQPEIKQIKASVQELHDLLRDTKQNPDRATLKKVLDKLASSIDGYIRSALGGKSEQAAGSLAGIQEALKKIRAVDDKNQARKNAGSPEGAAPAVKDLLAKIEFLLDGVKGEGSHQRSGANDQGSTPSFSFNAVKGDVSAKHTDVAAAAPKNSLFRENLESIIQNAKVVVRDSRNGSFSVRLHPDELGTVSISLKLHEGIVRGSFLVETPEAKELLTGNLEYIRQQLQDAGIAVGEFQVNVNDQRGRLLRDRDEHGSAFVAPAEQAVEIESSFAANALGYHDGRINLVI
ncbi:MAG: flagellar hook-length control protein FliK [Spirochaetes bacterium]|nr:flagellar hook-length control protein FliK [Spirochaetota bacterium]